MTRRSAGLVLAMAAILGAARSSGASEIGHYAAGLLNIRDLAVPEPGFYGAVYNYGYRTDQLNDRHGNEVDDLTLVGPRGNRATLNLDLDVDLYALAPAFMWVAETKLLGHVKYGALVLPTFANASISAALAVATRQGVEVDAGQFDVGDLYVQPVWLGLTDEHFDVAFGLGFYAPVGRYDVVTTRLPRLGRTIEAEAPDNIGYGFWTEQTQLAGYWYPFANHGTAVGLALTHEIHSNKEDFELTPGQNLTLNWGVSQYLPLTEGPALLAEVGVAGYDTWQVTADSGDDRTSSALDQVHAVGPQVGLTYVPWGLLVNFHWLYEYAAKDRFQGQVLGLNVAKKF
jgi:hypothetical protein